MMRPFLVFFALACVASGFGLGAAACVPADHAELRPLLVPASRLTCIVLRAITTSGTLDEICATADELAPYVSDLLAARAAGESDVATDGPAPLVAFSMPPPTRRVSRRRCVSWVPLASLKDAGGHDAAPE